MFKVGVIYQIFCLFSSVHKGKRG